MNLPPPPVADLLSNQINYLIRRKFGTQGLITGLLSQPGLPPRPDLPSQSGLLSQALSTPPTETGQGRGILAKAGSSGSEHQQEVEAYRAELQSKSVKEIEALYRAEKLKERQEEAEREDRKKFFHHPDADADYSHWVRAAYWTLDEAVALMLGKNPETVTRAKVLPYVNLSPFAKQYIRLYDLANRALLTMQFGRFVLFGQVPPEKFLEWAQCNDLPIPEKLMEMFKIYGRSVIDWRENCKKIEKDFWEIVEIQKNNKRVFNENLKSKQKVEEERDALRNRVAELESVTEVVAERDALRERVAELENKIERCADSDHPFFPPELDAAITAWRAVSRKRDPSKTVKQQLEDWIGRNNKHLSKEATSRIAVVCNWEKQGGRRRQD